jgi:hypothetical protein
VTGRWIKLHNEEFQNLFSSPSIIAILIIGVCILLHVILTVDEVKEHELDSAYRIMWGRHSPSLRACYMICPALRCILDGWFGMD